MIEGTPFERAFYILAGIDTDTISTKENAYRFLKKLTGQDFGYDPVAWLEYGIREDYCLHLGADYLAEFQEKWEASTGETFEPADHHD